jgi:hypothetical protein
MRKHWDLVTIGAATVLLNVSSRSLAAQASQPDGTRTLMDAAIGFTMSGPADVNQRPLCEQLNLPCNTPKTFPDFGVALQLAVHATSHLAVVAEASDYTNMWDTVGVGRAAQRENNAVGLLVGARATTPVLYFTLKDTVGIVLFAQVLGGSETATVVPTRFALQPGIGVQGHLPHPGFWFRESFDYRWTRGGPRNLSTVRAMFALVVAR